MRLSFAIFVALVLNLSAYDKQLASKFDGFFQNLTGKNLCKSDLFIDQEMMNQWLKAAKKPLLIDIRTGAEAAVVGLNAANSRHIALDALFSPKSLDSLPKDQKIVLVCHSGTRALMAGVNLRMLGFRYVYVLKEGIVGLANYTTFKTAP